MRRTTRTVRRGVRSARKAVARAARRAGKRVRSRARSRNRSRRSRASKKCTCDAACKKCKELCCKKCDIECECPPKRSKRRGKSTRRRRNRKSSSRSLPHRRNRTKRRNKRIKYSGGGPIVPITTAASPIVILPTETGIATSVVPDTAISETVADVIERRLEEEEWEHMGHIYDVEYEHDPFSLTPPPPPPSLPPPPPPQVNTTREIAQLRHVTEVLGENSPFVFTRPDVGDTDEKLTIGIEFDSFLAVAQDEVLQNNIIADIHETVGESVEQINKAEVDIYNGDTLVMTFTFSVNGENNQLIAVKSVNIVGELDSHTLTRFVTTLYYEDATDSISPQIDLAKYATTPEEESSYNISDSWVVLGIGILFGILAIKERMARPQAVVPLPVAMATNVLDHQDAVIAVASNVSQNQGGTGRQTLRLGV